MLSVCHKTKSLCSTRSRHILVQEPKQTDTQLCADTLKLTSYFLKITIKNRLYKGQQRWSTFPGQFLSILPADPQTATELNQISKNFMESDGE